MNVLSLFSGIGGIDLGLERAGMKIKGQVEIDDYCIKILKKHWPGVKKWKDIIDFNLMSLQAGFPAKTYLLPEKAQALRENEAVYGLKCSKAFAWYDRNTSLWKTFQCSFTGEWVPFSAPWPRAGMIRNGIAYQRQPLVPLTDVIGYSLWPSPRSSMAMARRLTEYGASQAWDRNGNLEDIILRYYPQEAIGKFINPVFVEKMMGFPSGWNDLEPLETQLSRKSPSSSEGGSSDIMGAGE